MTTPDGSSHSSAKMQQAANWVDEKYQALHHIRGQLEIHHNELQQGWHGKAASAFHNTYVTFDEELGKVIRSLHGLRDKLNVQHKQYTLVGDRSTEAVSQVQKIMDGDTL